MSARHSQSMWLPPKDAHASVSTLAGKCSRVDEVSKHKPKDYRPWILRIPTLLSILILTLALIGLIEYACRILPPSSSNSAQAFTNPSINSRNVNEPNQRRDIAAQFQASYMGLIATSVANKSLDQLPSSPMTQYSTFSAARDSYLNRITTSSNTATSSPSPSREEPPNLNAKTSLYLSLTQTTSRPVGSAAPTSYLSLTQTTARLAGSAAPASYLSLTQTTIRSPGSAPPTSYLSLAQTTLSLSPNTPTTTSNSLAKTTILPTTSLSDYLKVTQTTIASSARSSQTITQGSSESTFGSQAPGSQAPGSYLSPSSLSGPVSSVYTGVMTTLIANAETTIVLPLDPSSVSTAESQRKGHVQPNGTTVLVYPIYKYFIGAYLPIILAVLYRLLWTAVYATVKIMEPFHQLSQPEGALGKDSLTTYYQSSNFTPEPIFGYLRGHWVVLWSSIVYIASDLMAPLASETLFTDTKSGCTGGTGANPCFPRLSVDRAIARLMQGLLGAVSALIIAITILLYRRPTTGLFADPSSIATMASLLNHEHVIEDFQRLDPAATDDEMKKQFKEKRYRLTWYRSGTGVVRYGVIPVYDVQSANERHYISVHQPNVPTSKRRRLGSSAFLIILRDVLFGLVLLGILGLVIAYYKAAGDTPFNVFMNSQSFGPRFIMTAVASFISSAWKRIEREVRIAAPYRILSGSPSNPRSTILYCSTKLPLTTFFNALYHRHFFLSFIAFVALLSEILVVMLAGVPFQSAQTWFAFLVSAYTSMAILGMMIVGLAALFWWRSGVEFPRMPDTVAAVFSYLCASYMLADFEALEGLEEKDRDARIKAWGKRYEYGQSMGIDGVVRWAVDEDMASVGQQDMYEVG